MVFTARTAAAARAKAAELRHMLRGTDWRVQITPPLFPGDTFTIIAA